MPSIPAVKGTHDVLPTQGAAWEWLHDLHRSVTAGFGYRLIESPVLEHTELFERGVGAGTDVVDKEMFTFESRGERSLTLRPEGTVGALRALLDAHLDQEPKPLRVRYAGPMFRYDQPQRGRHRQFFQVGIECVGERSPHLDVEVIEAGWRFFDALGIEGVQLRLNSLGELVDRVRYRSVLSDYFGARFDQLCEDCRRRLAVNPLRLLDCKRDAGIVGGAPDIADSLSPESTAYFETVQHGLGAAGIAFVRDPRLVRGLDYYAHTAFEYQHRSLQGAQNALGGGGRYDLLAEVLGFPSTAGVGYALGVERILLVAAEQGRGPDASATADLLVCAVGAGMELAAADVARRLRAGGSRCALDVSPRKLDRKLRDAGRLGARFAVLVGTDEAAAGAVTLRDLATREQEQLAIDEVVQRLGAARTQERADDH